MEHIRLITLIRTTILSWLFIQLTAMHVFAQNTDTLQPKNILQQKLDAWQVQGLPEKLFVHTDRDFYLAGETCWFKIYAVDAMFNKPLDLSKVAYVELYDQSNHPALQVKVMMEDGRGNGSLLLPVNMGSGRYRLRAYTRWMRNFNPEYFFSEQLTVVNTRRSLVHLTGTAKPAYDLQLFPEGGNLVNGLPATVAFRIVDQQGRGQSCSGIIRDENGDTVAQAATLKFGMGRFTLTPNTKHHYTASFQTADGQLVSRALPAAYDNGYVMAVTSDGASITVNVRASFSSDAVYLFVQTRGLTKQVLETSLRNGEAKFTIPTDRMGEGISQLTVFNSNRQPVCERLFFKRPPPTLQPTINMSRTDYRLRDKVTVSLTMPTTPALSAAANLSLSVYKLDSLNGWPQTDIAGYLILAGDLSGTIEAPGYYLTNTDAEVAEATDNLMMTQGWRRFKWEEVLAGKTRAFEFAPEYRGHQVIGRIINNSSGRPEKGAETFLSIPGTHTRVRGSFSNDSGYVKFDMPNFFGTNEIIAETNYAGNHIEISNPFAPANSADTTRTLSLPDSAASALASQHAAVQVQNTYTAKWANRWMEKDRDTMPFYYKADKTYWLDDYVRFTTVEEILREYVPDVNVRRQGGQYSLPVFDNIRREFFRAEPLVLLDGIPVLDANRIMAYDPLKIKKLDVVARLYFYGDMIFDGIVNFITYDGDIPGYELDPRATVVDYETLQQAREFFMPVYENTEQVSSRLPDFRTLLYWQPDINILPGKPSSINFYTSDIAGRYALVIEGLTTDGRPVVGHTTIMVKEALPATNLNAMR